MRKSLYLLIIFLGLISCQNDEVTPVSNTNELGTVRGIVTTPSNKVVPNAKVFYDDNGEVYITKTDINGEFLLEVPSGAGSLEIQTGNGKLFRTSVAINVTTNAVLDLTQQNLRLNNEANFAFLNGAYDNIQNIITDLGYTVDEVSLADIESPNGLEAYDALFLNCDNNTAALSSEFYQSLNNFVGQGGSLYTSDWSLEYLVGYAGDAQDCTVDRIGGFIDDAMVCGIKSGVQETLMGNTIVDQDLSDFTNFTNLDIEYDLGSWMQLQNVDTNFWEVLIHDANSNPLMLKTNQVGASVNEDNWYSDNGNKVTICHIPPGNSDNAQTITINVSALDAHLAHGCSIGSCDAATSGNIYYTTFHNHIDGGSSTEIVKILEYMVLNL